MLFFPIFPSSYTLQWLRVSMPLRYRVCSKKYDFFRSNGYGFFDPDPKPPRTQTPKSRIFLNTPYPPLVICRRLPIMITYCCHMSKYTHSYTNIKQILTFPIFFLIVFFHDVRRSLAVSGTVLEFFCFPNLSLPTPSRRTPTPKREELYLRPAEPETTRTRAQIKNVKVGLGQSFFSQHAEETHNNYRRKSEIGGFFFRLPARVSFFGSKKSRNSEAHMSKKNYKPYKISPITPPVPRVPALKMAPFWIQGWKWYFDHHLAPRTPSESNLNAHRLLDFILPIDSEGGRGKQLPMRERGAHGIVKYHF